MRALNHTYRLGAATLLATLLGSYLYSASADAAEYRDISRVNTGVHVDADTRVGDVSSVNGSIDLGRGVVANDVGTVNGGIDLRDNVEIEDAETVNGGIRTGTDVTVHGSLETVNGHIRTASGTDIERKVRTVNGQVRLIDTRVGGDVQTSNGSVILRDGTTVEGDLIIRSRLNWFNRIFNFNRSKPEITIDATSSVLGDIHLYREAELHIDDGAQVGDIIHHY